MTPKEMRVLNRYLMLYNGIRLCIVTQQNNTLGAVYFRWFLISFSLKIISINAFYPLFFLMHTRWQIQYFEKFGKCKSIFSIFENALTLVHHSLSLCHNCSLLYASIHGMMQRKLKMFLACKQILISSTLVRSTKLGNMSAFI